MPYFVYILTSLSADKYYIGSSENPERRLKFHNTVEKGFTSRYRPWEIVFMMAFNTKPEAQSAENRIESSKSWKMIWNHKSNSISFFYYHLQ